ncbi:unnamed protein product [Closterium sp. NIES-65]|nr:unnamed protein product [Closterium sp. NIES-65]
MLPERVTSWPVGPPHASAATFFPVARLGRVAIFYCPAPGWRVTPTLPVARPVARDGALNLPVVRPVARDGALLVVRPEAHDAVGGRVCGWRVLECWVVSFPSPPPPFVPTAAAAAGGEVVRVWGSRGSGTGVAGVRQPAAVPPPLLSFPPSLLLLQQCGGGEGGG